MADIVDRWIDLLVAGLAADQRDGCPIEPIATESVNASPLVRAASARAFSGLVRGDRGAAPADGWPAAEAERVALAVISLIEGALILSRIAGDARRAQRRQTRGARFAAAAARARAQLNVPAYISRPMSSTRTEWVSAPTAR